MAISIEPSVRGPKWEGGKITNDEDDTDVVMVTIVGNRSTVTIRKVLLSHQNLTKINDDQKCNLTQGEVK